VSKETYYSVKRDLITYLYAHTCSGAVVGGDGGEGFPYGHMGNLLTHDPPPCHYTYVHIEKKKVQTDHDSFHVPLCSSSRKK